MALKLIVSFELDGFRDRARHLSDDEWRRLMRTEAARAIGSWLEARGRLNQPIRTLSLSDLEAMHEASVARWIVLASLRLKECQARPSELDWLLGG